MINNDLEAYKIIVERIQKRDLVENERKILSFVSLLMKDYSFVKNQTYPRPFHPDIDKRKDAYFTLIAIILSLRTTLENEQKAVNLFMKKYHSIEEVVNCDIKELKTVISCAGMSTKKSKIILEVSNLIIKNYSGDINNINTGDISKTRENLMKLPGIGDKSADCLLELAFNLPSIVVDTNVFRVVTRLFFDKTDMSFTRKRDVLKVKEFLEKNIVKDFRIFQIVHTILLLHGKYICKSIPNCNECKVNRNCNYYSSADHNEQLTLF